MRRRTLAWVVLAVPAVAPVAARAGPYTGLVAFGDSLSDVGNDQVVSTNPPGNLFLPPTPGPYYFQGRFSNGPNYVDDLSARLGLAAPVPSATLPGGLAPGGSGHAYDFAYGGARTAGSPVAQRALLPDVDQQLAAYETANTPAAGDLFVLFAGANDLLAQSTATPAAAAAAAATAADNLAGDVSSLYGHGARQFLVPNLPLLGDVPRVRGQGPAAQAAADGLTQVFNARLAADLFGLQSADPGIAVHTLDTATLIAAVQSTPGLYGFNDAVDSAAPGLSPGATAYDTSLEVPAPDTYLFWDDLHPTRAGNLLLAQAAFAAVVPEPATLSLAAGVVLALGRRRRRR